MGVANRLLRYEAKLCGVSDPLVGSYYVEALTDEVVFGDLLGGRGKLLFYP